MEVYYIEVFFKGEPKNIEKLKEILPERFGLVAVCNYKLIAEKIIDLLKDKEIIKKENYFITGCDVSAAELPVDTILVIGSRFHALEVKRRTGKRTILYEPLSGHIEEIEDKDFWKKVNILRYYLKESKKIGIVISIKPGQYSLERALEIKEKLKDKEVYLFLADTINFDELKNFDIDFWIFVACPRIIDDILVRNIKGLPDYLIDI